MFGTNVMVTVAKSFEAPIKLVFPQDLLENGLGATNMAMLGLGDIVIPGDSWIGNRPILTYEVLGRGSEVRGTRYKFGPMRRQKYVNSC